MESSLPRLGSQGCDASSMTRLPESVIVEDEARTAGLPKLLLERGGHEVGIEPHADTAVERTLAARSDLVVLDVSLPSMDGSSFYRAVRRSYTGITLMLPTRGTETSEGIGIGA